jgi:bifunctional non-homologous end joining protein LigD
VRSIGSTAEKSEMPGFITPQLATLKSKAPCGDWLHEIKYDGYRIQLHVNRGTKKAFTRNGLNWVKRFSAIAGALDIAGQAIIDGEVVIVHEGRTNFSELQADLASGKQDRLLYYAFDLLWRNGDLRKLPQIKRKQMLADLLSENDIGLPIVYSEHLVGDGQEMFEHAAKLNFEGIVSKNARAPYRSDRNEGGTGWSRTVSSQIRKQLDTVVTPQSKLTKPVKKPKATWVEPKFFADIEYRDITSEGLLRASSFKALNRT